MAFRIEPGESIGDGLCRVAAERLDDALGHLDGLSGADPVAIEAAVHETRKRCKELRALALLASDGLGKRRRRFDRTVRDAARALSARRDAQVMVGTVDVLVESRLAQLAGCDADAELASLGQARAVASAAAVAEPGGEWGQAESRRLLVRARRHVDGWELHGDFDLIAPGLRQTYVDGRRGLRVARRAGTDEAMHTWRRAVKNLWYQLRLLEATAPSVLSPAVGVLDELGEALGHDHDLAVTVARLESDAVGFGGAEAVGRVIAAARRRQAQVRVPALRMGATVYAEKPDAFVARLRRYRRLTDRFGPED